MEQYISKSALVVEIKRLLVFYSKEIEDNKEDPWAMDIAKRDILQEILSFIDTLEVKDVNFKDTKSVFEGQYLSKDKVVTTIERLQDECEEKSDNGGVELLEKLFNKLSTFEVKDPYEQCVQYDSIKAGIQAHAEEYSFNIESELFNQLTKEQQALWRKEIEEACISGGYAGYQLAKDPRYKENLEVKEVDLCEEEERIWKDFNIGECHLSKNDLEKIAKHFFELGLKAQRKSISIQNVDDVLKESGVDPDSKVAKMFKESYYAAIDKLLEQKRK